jgi:hypothetical protein
MYGILTRTTSIMFEYVNRQSVNSQCELNENQRICRVKINFCDSSGTFRFR